MAEHLPNQVVMFLSEFLFLQWDSLHLHEHIALVHSSVHGLLFLAGVYKTVQVLL